MSSHYWLSVYISNWQNKKLIELLSAFGGLKSMRVDKTSLKKDLPLSLGVTSNVHNIRSFFLAESKSLEKFSCFYQESISLDPSILGPNEGRDWKSPHVDCYDGLTFKMGTLPSSRPWSSSFLLLSCLQRVNN